MERIYTNYEIHKDLLEIILKEKTGYLLTQPGDRKLFFEEGQLVFAKSAEKGENFADILVEMGKISETQLTDLKSQLPTGESLGKALREKGFATPKDLGAALKHQIMRIITEVILTSEGKVQTSDEVLPEKMPKLRISTLPLFVKNILLIESPEFPPQTSEAHLPQDAHISRTENYESLLKRSNLPDHYEPYISEFDTILLANTIPEGIEMSQFRKLVYVFHLMGMIKFDPIADMDAPGVDALDLGLQAETDPFDQLGLPDDSEGLLEEENDLFDLADASDGEVLSESMEGLDLEDFNPLDVLADEEDPSNVDMTVSDAPIEELLKLNPLAPKEEAEAPTSNEEFEEVLREEEFSPVPSGEFSEEFTDDQEDEDPIEALNRALADTDDDDLDLYQDSDDDHLLVESELLNDQNETVPGHPIDELRASYQENAPLDFDDLSDGPTIPGEFTASDLEPTHKLPVLEMEASEDIPFEPESPSLAGEEFPAFEAEPTPAPLDNSFILPDPEEDDDLQYFEKSRTWPYIVIPILILFLGVSGYLFRDRLPSFGQITSIFSASEPVEDTDIENSPDEVADKAVIPDNTSSNEDIIELDSQTSLTLEDQPLDPQVSEESTLTAEETATTPELKKIEPEKVPASIEKDKPAVQQKPVVQVSPVVEEPIAAVEKTQTAKKPASILPGQSIEEVIAISRNAFNSTQNRFTLVFMVACLRETVEKAIVNHPEEAFYIIQRPSDGKMCYCLSWGEFASRKDARNASSRMPKGLMDPGGKPWVLKVN